MSYRLIENYDGILREADGATIPNDVNNRDWREYQKWLDAGNTPAAAAKPSPAEQARNREIEQAASVARQWLKDHPAAVAFLRLTPAEQEAQIDVVFVTMTPQQREFLKALIIPVSALVKQRWL